MPSAATSLRAALVAVALAASSLAAVPAHAEGVEFIDDAKALYRMAACGGTEAVDAAVTKVVDKHCKKIDEKLKTFRAAYFEKHRSWFDAVVPKDVPKTVVYPFGGGDLISALVAFPDATEITTISLELAGDPRRIKTLSSKQLELALGGLRAEIGGLISVGSNTTANLSAGQQNELPAQVSSFLIGLVAGGYEPVSMRYFKLDDTGAVVYLEQADIEAAERAQKPKKKPKPKVEAPAPVDGSPPVEPKPEKLPPNFSLAFSNVEIQYRKVGETAVRVHRHIGWDLSDRHLKLNPQVLRHLEKKGQVTILVKGASYLLWNNYFSRIREYILDHLKWMLSDSTGVPPSIAKKAGMVQETYGAFTGAFLETSRGTLHDEAFIELWKKQKKRKLAFRFGYVDANKQAHLVVTRPK